MIYLDSSVALAYLFGETRRPEDDFWRATFASSRLLKFEVFNRINARPVTAARAMGFEVAAV